MKTSVVSAQLAEMERRSRALVKRVLVWQIAMSLMAAFPAQAQRVGSEVTIGVIGAPEEPRFSEIVAGLKNGFGELGYDKQSPQILERRVARAEESAAKSVVERLMREKPQVLFLIGPTNKTGSRSVIRGADSFHHSGGSGFCWCGRKLSPARRQHNSPDFRIS